MDWNLLMIVTALIFLAGAVTGLIKGGMRIGVSVIATVLTLAIVFFANPYVTKALMDLTPIDDVLERQLHTKMIKILEGEDPNVTFDEERIRSIMEAVGITEEQLAEYGVTVEEIANGTITGEDLEEYGISSDVWTGLASSILAEEDTQPTEGITIEETTESSRQEQIQAIQSASIPRVFKEMLLDNNNKEIYAMLGAQTFAGYISKILTRCMLGIITFLLSFLVVMLFIRAIIFALDFVEELPSVGVLNRVIGVILGVAMALLIVELLFMIITMLYSTQFGRDMMGMISENPFLDGLYNTNLLMKIAIMLR